MSQVVQAFSHGLSHVPPRGSPPGQPPVTSEAGSLGWMSDGACRQVDPELFFPIAVTGPAARQAEAAKAVCGPCAVRANCLSYALKAMPEGIWGGTTQEERRAARALPSAGPGTRRAAGPAGQDSIMSLPAASGAHLTGSRKRWRTMFPVSDRCSRSLPGWSATRQCP